ncbi:MAG: precorrin-3B C(17)-methyltransferase [Pseudanabaenaceae cyanobacterium bins.68]|nr:precorrin-3B C(17)-methyltransferase [Pseudanabaenaceae cyanobacterium bins.68]
MAEPAILILSDASWAIAQQIQAVLPQSSIYGLRGRVAQADIYYDRFTDQVSQLFRAGRPILGICASGILITSLVGLLQDKRLHPPVLAIAADGSVVVPLLGSLQGANQLARLVAEHLGAVAAITTAAEVKWQTNLLTPPPGYVLLNSDQTAKVFVADVLAGAELQLEGEADWLRSLPFQAQGSHRIQVLAEAPTPDYLIPDHTLVYYRVPVPGKLMIVGIGPGDRAWLSPEAKTALDTATDLVGYYTYLDLVKPWLGQQNYHGSDNRQESDRAKQALDLAGTGAKVALISSGDPGIFAMASAVFEVLETQAQPLWEQIEIQVIPGISAMQAAAALVGAPLGHDFCVISLSDILKPWAVIEHRLRAALVADLVIALYNPRSSQRPDQLSQAQQLLLTGRHPDTPVVLATSLGRANQAKQITTLAQLNPESVTMQTLVIVGSSQTRKFARANGEVWVYTPRRYSQA